MAPLPVPNELGKRTEIKLLEPRLARLSEEQRREAVALLADLLLDATKRRAGVSGGGSADVMDGASGSVVPFRESAGRRAVARDPADAGRRHKRVNV